MQERETPKTSLKLLRMRDLTAEYGLTPASVVNRRAKLTPDRRPMLTPLSREVFGL